jgi:competence protein ComEA
MPTPNERKALTFLVLVALSGTAVRLVRANSSSVKPTQQDSAALDAQLQRVDSVRARKSQRITTPVADTGPALVIDLDRASADVIEALPGVGPMLAKRIVANRDSAGAFGNLDGLCDVSGIGRAVAERLRPLVTFSGAPRPVSDGCGAASKPRAKSRASHPRNKR